jgi:hypothetical protein
MTIRDTGTTTAADQGRDYLCELFGQVRGHTIELLKAAEPAWLLWAPAGTSNHMMWHAGHALWVQDALGIELMTGASELPAGWADLFGMNCRPVKNTHHWPGKLQVAQLLERQWTRWTELVAQLPSERLILSAADRSSLVPRLIHGVHDEARHHGEMYLLYKLCRAGAGSSARGTQSS